MICKSQLRFKSTNIDATDSRLALSKFPFNNKGGGGNIITHWTKSFKICADVKIVPITSWPVFETPCFKYQIPNRSSINYRSFYFKRTLWTFLHFSLYRYEIEIIQFSQKIKRRRRISRRKKLSLDKIRLKVKVTKSNWDRS